MSILKMIQHSTFDTTVRKGPASKTSTTRSHRIIEKGDNKHNKKMLLLMAMCLLPLAQAAQSDKPYSHDDSIRAGAPVTGAGVREQLREVQDKTIAEKIIKLSQLVEILKPEICWQVNDPALFTEIMAGDFHDKCGGKGFEQYLKYAQAQITDNNCRAFTTIKDASYFLQDACFSDIVHECIHVLAAPGGTGRPGDDTFFNAFGTAFSEGCTQYFTKVVCSILKPGEKVKDAYMFNVLNAESIASEVGFDVFFNAYFYAETDEFISQLAAKMMSSVEYAIANPIDITNKKGRVFTKYAYPSYGRQENGTFYPSEFYTKKQKQLKIAYSKKPNKLKNKLKALKELFFCGKKVGDNVKDFEWFKTHIANEYLKKLNKDTGKKIPEKMEILGMLTVLERSNVPGQVAEMMRGYVQSPQSEEETCSQDGLTDSAQNPLLLRLRSKEASFRMPKGQKYLEKYLRQAEQACAMNQEVRD